jgi:hypothetical protein
LFAKSEFLNEKGATDAKYMQQTNLTTSDPDKDSAWLEDAVQKSGKAGSGLDADQQ